MLLTYCIVTISNDFLHYHRSVCLLQLFVLVVCLFYLFVYFKFLLQNFDCQKCLLSYVNGLAMLY